MSYAPLHGVRVLDLTRLHPGAITTRKLADMGADVVKVEEPGVGDYIRLIPPLVEGVGLNHWVFNRGKMSVVLDLTASGGLAQLEKLGLQADVIIDSFRPGKLKRGSLKPLGDLLADLRRRRPELIRCSITGFGMTGPFAEYPAHGNTLDALSGTMTVMRRDGSPEIGAQTALAPNVGALNAVAAIGMALLHAQRTGQGVAIDISCWDAAVDCRSTRLAYSMGGHGRLYNVNEAGPLHRLYETADGELMLFASVEKKFWLNFCDAIDRSDLVSRWNSGGAALALEQDVELYEELREIFRSRTRDEWSELFVANDVIGTPVLKVEELSELEHFRARRLAGQTDGPLPIVYDPIRWVDDDSRPGNNATPAPLLGEHQDLAFKRWLPS
jgi:alpha-methylacyl-CoA racemase